MRRLPRNLGKVTALAAAASVAAAGAPALFGATTTPVVIDDVIVSGGVIALTLSNHDVEAHTGTVRVKARVDGRVVSAATTFTVGGGQTAFLRFNLGDTVQEILELGAVVDDGTPF
jgi:hypothetical protein